VGLEKLGAKTRRALLRHDVTGVKTRRALLQL